MDITMGAAVAPLPEGGFSPVVAVEPAKEATVGSKNFNDADKANYFEGEDD